MRLDPTFGDLRALRAKMVLWARVMTRGADVEDLVQAALLKMIAGRHMAPAVPSEIESWARVVLLNTLRDIRRVDARTPSVIDLDHVLLAAPDNPETSTYCRQVFREVLRWCPSLLLDPEPRGNRWMADATKTVTERRRRYRARKAVAEMVA
jgi:DNA-directed RNA polymerase specialized sigma24 family protein